MPIPAVLERQVGPFPVIVWAGLVTGGVGLGLVLRRRIKPGAGVGKTLPMISDAGGNPTGTTMATTAGQVTRGGTVVVPQPAQNPAVIRATSNQEWARAAVSYLISTGVDPAAAQAAITRFVDGSGLTSQELGFVSKAIGATGPPPEYVAPPAVVPVDAPAAPKGFQSSPTQAIVETITPPGALVSPDGNTVYWSDGVRVQWVQNGDQSKALAAAGAAIKSMVNAGSPDEYPEPLYASMAAIRTQRLIGPPPPGVTAW